MVGFWIGEEWGITVCSELRVRFKDGPSRMGCIDQRSSVKISREFVG